jgi:Holliday junction resolvase RusA-like endonuclease
VGPRIVKRVACRRRRDDVDNIKALLDALSGILWLDDGQIADLCISKRYDPDRPRVELSLKLLGGQ